MCARLPFKWSIAPDMRIRHSYSQASGEEGVPGFCKAALGLRSLASRAFPRSVVAVLLRSCGVSAADPVSVEAVAKVEAGNAVEEDLKEEEEEEEEAAAFSFQQQRRRRRRQ